jgi:hypothetical protein
MNTSLSTFVIERPSFLVRVLQFLFGLVNPPWVTWPGEGRTKEFVFQRLVLDEIYLLFVVPDEVFFLMITVSNLFFTLLLGWAFALLFNCTLLFSLSMVIRFVWFLDWLMFGLWRALPGVAELIWVLDCATECVWEGIRMLVAYFPPLAAWRGLKHLVRLAFVSAKRATVECWFFPTDFFRFVRHYVLSDGLFLDQHLLGSDFLWFTDRELYRWRPLLPFWLVVVYAAAVPYLAYPVFSFGVSASMLEVLSAVSVLGLCIVGRNFVIPAVVLPLFAIDVRVDVTWVCYNQMFCLGLLFCLSCWGTWERTEENSRLYRLCNPRDVIGEDGRMVPGPVSAAAKSSQDRLQALARGKAWARLEGTDLVSVAGVAAATSRIRPRGRLTAAIAEAISGPGMVGSFLRGRWTPDLPSSRRSPAVNALLTASRDGLKVLGVGTEPCATGFKDYVLVESCTGERRLIFPELQARLHLYASLRPRDYALFQGIRSRSASWFKDEGLPSWCILLAFSSSVADALEVSRSEEVASRKVGALALPALAD